MPHSLQSLITMGVDVRLIHAHILDSAVWDSQGPLRYTIRDINEKDREGRTALDIAIQKSNTAVMNLLRQYGGKLGAEIP